MSDQSMKWYEKNAEGLTKDGWNSTTSQQVRFDANMRAIEAANLMGAKLSVLDFGCGTGSFASLAKPVSYIGIEEREKPRKEAAERLRKSPGFWILYDSIPEEVKYKVSIVIANGVYAFPDQNPVKDLQALAKLVKPQLIIVDFFDIDFVDKKTKVVGYNPNNIRMKIAAALEIVELEFDRYMIDHNYSMHAFTLSMFRGKSAWEQEYSKKGGW